MIANKFLRALLSPPLTRTTTLRSGKLLAKLYSQRNTVIPQILLCEDRGPSFRHDDVDFAHCIVNSSGSTFGRIAVCVKLAAESAYLFGCALSGIEIHEISPGMVNCNLSHCQFRS